MPAPERLETAPPEAPLPRGRAVVIYDGECTLCRRWALRWWRLAGERLDFVPLQSLGERLPRVERAALLEAVHLVEPDGRTSRGAAALLRVRRLAAGEAPGGRLDFALAPLLEPGYRLVAGHRRRLGPLARLLFGRIEVPETWQASRALFLRALALVYLIAFWSFGVQAEGLVGSRGILPAADYLEQLRAVLGTGAWARLPTLFWLAPGDGMLALLWIAGMAVAVVALLGFAPTACFALLWALYLSVFGIGQEFLSFQWDILLLEAGFLAIFYAPLTWRLDSRRAPRPSALVRFLIVWLLLRLMFESGLTKLLSGDRSWLDGTALGFHWYTQPLPTWTSWWVAQAPPWADLLGVWWTFGVELLAPWLLLFPRWPRTAGALLIAAFMVHIAATGNYGFFNLLTVALCLAAIDDGVWSRWLPRRLAPRGDWRARERLPKRLLGVLVALVVLPLGLAWGAFDAARTAGRAAELPAVARQLAPWRLANAYGLFRVMTKERPEIVVEASDDGVEWRAYRFRYKPGPLDGRPGFVEPHMPRLDWQMWFAALRGRPPRWFVAFVGRLLEAEPAVLDLLAESPGGGARPRLVRAQLYDYRFTTREERRASGEWWSRRSLGLYLSPLRRVAGTPAR